MAVHFNAFDQKLIDIEYIDNKCEYVDNHFPDKLSLKFWRFYTKYGQNYKVLERKIRLKNRMSATLSKYFNENGLKFVDIFINGSTVNGFGTLCSDIDLCFVVTDQTYDLDLAKQKKLKILSEIETLLSINGFELDNCQLIEARVPILRYVDKESGIQVEINVNNEIGIRNTRLLYCYSKLDWRVVPVCLALKTWCKSNSIIDAFNGFLSSYTVELLVIFYLQNCSPPLLPCLQQTDYEMFYPSEEIITYKTLPDLTKLTPFATQNKQSLAELFVGFFHFYIYSFDFLKQVVSVRSGRPIDKQDYEPYRTDHQWEYIAVEEPFSGTNSGRTVYDVSAYNKIVKEFKQMYDKSLEIMSSDCVCK